MEIAVGEMLHSRSEHTGKPDPLVGVVLVDRYGKELARAHRGSFGHGDHAEFTIFEKLTSDEDPVGGTLYVTLEPCAKRERPKKPCAQRIIEKGIKRVVIGMKDPNPEIYGRGVDLLQKHNVKVDYFDEDLKEEIKNINKEFSDFMNEQKKEKKMHPQKIEAPSLEELRSVPEADLKDLSYDAIRKYLKLLKLKYSVPSSKLWDYFLKTKFVVNRQNRKVPTLAGIVLFAKNPEVFLPEHRITAEHFTGTPEDGVSLERISQDGRLDIKGPLLQMVEMAERFYKDKVGRVPRLRNFKRVERDYEYPIEVIREAIINALIHRDYAVGAHVSFRIFRDRIIVKSPGHLLFPNTIERIRSFDVTPARRNQRLADAAFNMKRMEREGYGIPMMPIRLREYGLRPPDFKYDGGYFSVIFYGREKSSPAFGIQPEIREQLTSRQIDIINLAFEQKKVTSQEIRNKFKITRETANQDFTKLLGLGLLVRKGTGRATYYVLGRLRENDDSLA